MILAGAALVACSSPVAIRGEPETPSPAPLPPNSGTGLGENKKVFAEGTVAGNSVRVLVELCEKDTANRLPSAASADDIRTRVFAGETYFCRGEPLRSTSVVLWNGGNEITGEPIMSGTTDAAGIVELDLSNVAPPAGLDQSPLVLLRVNGRVAGMVDLSNLSVLPDWRAQLAEAQARRLKETEERMNRLDEDCDAGNANICLLAALEAEVQGTIGDSADYLRGACKLGNHTACGALQESLRLAIAEAAETSKGPKRDLDNPADVAALNDAVKAYSQCRTQCTPVVDQCVRNAPDGAQKAQFVKAYCEPEYVLCQRTCESALNREGFCLETRVLSSGETGDLVRTCP